MKDTHKKMIIVTSMALTILIAGLLFMGLEIKQEPQPTPISTADRGPGIDSEYDCYLVLDGDSYNARLSIKKGYRELSLFWDEHYYGNYTIQTDTYFQPNGTIEINQNTTHIYLRYDQGYYSNGGPLMSIYKTPKLNGTITHKWITEELGTDLSISTSSSSSWSSSSTSASATSSTAITSKYRLGIDNSTFISTTEWKYYAGEIGETYEYWPYEIYYVEPDGGN